MTNDASSVPGIDAAESASSSAEAACAPAEAAEPAAALDAHAQAAAGSPAQSVGFTLSSLGHAVARRFSETMRPLGLEPREFALLRAIAPAEGASQQAIGERLQIPPSRMVAFVDVLEERGLVERRPNPADRRARALYLTGAGRRLLTRAFKLASELEAQLCADLTLSEREELLDALQRVGAQLGVDPGIHAAHND